MNMKKRSLILQASVACLLMGMSVQSYASAFQAYEQNVDGMGNAHAGWAASASNASTGFYNPAGLVRIKHQELSVGGTAVILDTRFSGRASVLNNNNPPPSYGPVTGVSQGGGTSLIPNMNYSAPLSKRLTFGFGIDVPFGLKTDWSNLSDVRYTATKTSVKVIDVSPSLGFALTPKLSIGLGLDADYMDAVFGEMVRTGGTATFDNLSTNKGHDWGFGWHGGVLYQLSQHTRVGLSYRSQTKFNVRGDSAFTNFGSQSPIIAAQSTTNNMFAKVTLPATSALSVYHDLNKKWAVMGSIVYTQWDSIKAITLNNVNIGGTLIKVTMPTNFKNTFNYAIGADYKPTNKVTLKMGVGYDTSPTNNKDRNIRLPDANRLTLALGAHWQASNQLGLSVGWEHLFVHSAGINSVTIVGPDGVKEYAYTSGAVKSHADVLGAQLDWTFA